MKTEEGVYLACGRKSKEASLCDTTGARRRLRETESWGECTSRQGWGQRGVVRLQEKQFVAHVTGYILGIVAILPLPHFPTPFKQIVRLEVSLSLGGLVAAQQKIICRHSSS